MNGKHPRAPRQLTAALVKVAALCVLCTWPAPAAPELRPRTEAATTLRSFPGLDYTVSRGSDGLFRPPDTTVGTNGSQVLEATNSAIHLTTLDGTEIVPARSLNSFFGSDPTYEKVLFDPRVVYSRLGPYPRFFVVALHRNDEGQSASIKLAVSRSSTPSSLAFTQWCRYSINSVRIESDGARTWADFPMVGLGADAFLISNDQFTFANPGYKYRYGILRVFNKNVITNNATSCPGLASVLALTKVLPGTTSPLQGNGHVQPVFHNTAPSSFAGVSNPAYLVSTVNPAPTASTFRIFRVRNVSVGTPTLDDVQDVINLTGGTYRAVPAAKQPSPGKLLDNNDVRVLQVAGVGDTLFATFASGCPQPGLPDKPCVRVVRFWVGDNAGKLTAIIQEDVTIKSADSEVDLGYFMPGIAATPSGQTAVVVLTSSPSRYLTAAWTFKNSLEPFYPTPTPFSNGTCIKTATTMKVRIGDYVGAQTDPGTLGSFWLAGESAAVDGFGGCTWTTRVVQVAP